MTVVASPVNMAGALETDRSDASKSRASAPTSPDSSMKLPLVPERLGGKPPDGKLRPKVVVKQQLFER